MIIRYDNSKIEKACNDFKKAQRKHGPDIAKRLYMALQFLDSAETLKDVANTPSFNLHPLTGDRKGTYAIDLGRRSGFRLIIKPLDANGEEWAETDIYVIYQSTSIVILMEVTNHYE